LDSNWIPILHSEQYYNTKYLGISANAATASSLLTSRNINGVAFNGTSNITITANTPNALSISSELMSGGASTYDGSAAKTIGIQSASITNSMLAGSIGSNKLVGTDITTVGTIGTGTWQATPINLSSYASGVLPLANGGTGSSNIFSQNNTWTGTNIFSASLTAASAIARGTLISHTLNAAVNNDTLLGLDIRPNFNLGAYTGTQSLGLRVRNGNVVIGANTYLNAMYSATPVLYVSGSTSLNGSTYINQNMYLTGNSFTFEQTGISNNLPQWRADATGVLFGNYLSLPVRFVVGSAENMRLFSTGNVSIATTTDGGEKLNVAGNINLTTAGNKLKAATGTNAAFGTATLSGGTVTVNTTAVSASSLILITVQETGTNNGRVKVSARVASTSFTISSSDAGDNCVVAYQIIN
jgi:hypothetical protein